MSTDSDTRETIELGKLLDEYRALQKENAELWAALAKSNPYRMRICIFCDAGIFADDEHKPECIYRRAVEKAGER